MNEEKAMIEQKKSKGPFQWLKAQFEKIKQIFSGAKKEETVQQEGELTLDELDDIKAGYPNQDVIDFDEEKANIEEMKMNTSEKDQELSQEDLDKVTAGSPIVTRMVDKEELMADLGVTEQNPWDLTEEQLNEVRSSYPDEKQEELTEEQLDDITAGQPIVNDER